MSRAVGSFFLTLAVSWAMACTGAERRAAQPSWRQPEPAAPAAPRGRLVIEIAPASPAAQAYNDPPITTAPTSALADAVIREVARVSAELGKAPPVPDGRLYAAAHELARVAMQDAPRVYSLIEFALQWNGIIEPGPHLLTWGPSEDGGPLGSLRDLEGTLASNDFARLGVGVVERADGNWVAVLALLPSAIETEPIPRRVSAGGRLRVDGSIKAPFSDPAVFVTREDGNVEQLAVTAPAPGGFRFEMTCGDHRGRQQIEIAGHAPSGPNVLGNFPVWCGEEPPPAIQVALDADELAPIESGEEAEERLARMVNRDRERHGLPALVVDPRLTEVARSHSREMRDARRLAHVSPTTGTAADRVRTGQIKTSLVLENLARAYGVGEAEDGLMNSPGHRANILSRDATHMGLGVALGGLVTGRRELFVTQLLIRVPAKIDPRQAREELAAIVKRRRPLDEDRELSMVAQELADGMAAGEPQADLSRRATTRLAPLRLPYSKVLTVLGTTANLAKFQPDADLTDRTLTAFGAGVAQGDHDVIGEKAIHVVLLLGYQ